MAYAFSFGCPMSPSAPEQVGSAPTAVVAEDEAPLAEELVRLLGAQWPELTVVRTVADGVAAIRAIDELAPRLAFLDVQMPEVTGLEVARHIRGRCHVVFITAYEQHAIDAFEAGAIDYVLKPVTPARLLTTTRRLRNRLDESPCDLGPRLDAMVGTAAPRRYLQWVSAARGSQVRLLTVDDILYFRSDAKYTMVVTSESESLIRKTIKELIDELDPSQFWQIHRSAIVNLKAIDSVVHAGRQLSVRLRGRSETLPVAEAYHHLFRSM